MFAFSKREMTLYQGRNSGLYHKTKYVCAKELLHHKRQVNEAVPDTRIQMLFWTPGLLIISLSLLSLPIVEIGHQ